jgi:hypothetical protein
MSVWAELQRFRNKRSSEKHNEMERILLEIWYQGGLFCTNTADKPQWKPAPHPSYLILEYSRRFASTCIHRGDNPAQNRGYQSPPHSDSLPDSDPHRPPSPGQWAMLLTPLNVKDPTDEVEVLAKAIVTQLLENMDDQDSLDFGSSLRCKPQPLFDEERVVDQIVANIIDSLEREVSNEQSDALPLPDDFQSPNDFLRQARFWTSLAF